MEWPKVSDTSFLSPQQSPFPKAHPDFPCRGVPRFKGLCRSVHKALRHRLSTIAPGQHVPVLTPRERVRPDALFRSQTLKPTQVIEDTSQGWWEGKSNSINHTVGVNTPLSPSIYIPPGINYGGATLVINSLDKLNLFILRINVT